MDDKKSKKTRPESKKAATSAATKTAVRATNAPKQKTAPVTSSSGGPVGKPPVHDAEPSRDKSKELAAHAKENSAPPGDEGWDKTKEIAAEARDGTKDKIDDWRDKR